jgi:hypothetical protein
VTDDPLEPLTAICQGGGCVSRYHVGWSPAWNVWLCTECRWRRSESELRVSLAAREAMAAADRAKQAELEAAGG